MHDHHHHHESNSSVKNIRFAFFINLLFAIIELIGGIYTNSVSILSDALHDLSDAVSLGVSFFLEKKSSKTSNENFSYGYKRFSTLAALLNGVILSIGSFFILSEAIPRLFKPEDVNEKGMLVLALFGVLFNGIAALRLQKGDSLNEKMLTWHFIEDILGWVAVLIASVVMLFFDVPILDPILSICITLFIIYNVAKRTIQALKIFLQGTPKEIETKDIQSILKKIPSVIDIHDTHIWTLDGRYNILSTHLVVGDEITLTEANSIKNKAKKLLAENSIAHATIEIETESNICSQEDCVQV